MKDPETVKAYSRIAARLTELQLLLAGPDASGPLGVAEGVVGRIDGGLHREDSWDVAEQLKLLLLQFSSGARLEALLQAERAQEAEESRRARGEEAAYGHTVTWSSRLDPAELDALLADPGRSGWREHAVDRLALLYELRIDDWRHTRALTQLRANYLSAVALVLAVLLGAVLVSHWQSGGRVDLLLATTATGALGAVLTGVFKLRDEMMGIRQLRLYAPVLWALPVVGATAATLLFAVLASGLVVVAGIDPRALTWPQCAAFGFLAGFSEVFFLGVVRRLTGSAADAMPARPGAPADGAARRANEAPGASRRSQ